MCKNSEPWVFTLPEDFSWDSGFTVPGEWEFRDKTGAVRLILRRSGRITVTRRYAWDGCSPKVCVFDILLGTPDEARSGGEAVSAPSVGHVRQSSCVTSGCSGPLLRRRSGQEVFNGERIGGVLAGASAVRCRPETYSPQARALGCLSRECLTIL